jgi:hypothetical protein
MGGGGLGGGGGELGGGGLGGGGLGRGGLGRVCDISPITLNSFIPHPFALAQLHEVPAAVTRIDVVNFPGDIDQVKLVDEHPPLMVLPPTVSSENFKIG